MQPKTDFDVVVIGGGIVGLASAHKLAQHHPQLRLAILEKEDRLAAHQTGRNSGVIHSGLYYQPDSSKAKTCAAGREALSGFARRNDIAHEICGKIIVATDPSELPALEKILQNGQANGVEGLEKIGPERLRRPVSSISRRSYTSWPNWSNGTIPRTRSSPATVSPDSTSTISTPTS